MHCIKMFQTPFGIYLALKSLSETQEHLAYQVLGEVPTGCVLVEALISRVALEDITGELRHTL